MSTYTLDHRLPADHFTEALRADALRGLTGLPKSLPPTWFYDARGSELFEQITQLPEYYPTRTEHGILTARAPEIAAATGARTLVELGSGSSQKTRLLLDALRTGGTLRGYVPVDVSESALRQAATALGVDYPELEVHALVADFHQHLGLTGAPGPGCWPSSAAPSGTCCPPSARSSWPGSPPNSNRATRCCSARTWSRTRRRWSPPTTTPPG